MFRLGATAGDNMLGMNEAMVTVLVGPTAVGKGTVIARLRERFPQVYYSVSATTRQPRPGEVDGQHYHFIDEARFDQLIDAGGMLEWATVHGLNKYGTMLAPIEQAVEDGRPVLVEVDLDGARQIRKSLPGARQVFIAPPTFEDLARRLESRGTEDQSERERRLQTARVELAAQSEFDRVIVNHTVEDCVSELASFMGLE